MSDWSDAGLPAPRINPYSYFVDAHLDRTPFAWPRQRQEQIGDINRRELVLEFLLTHAELKLAEAFIEASGYSWFTMDLLSGHVSDACSEISIRLIGKYTVAPAAARSAEYFILRATVEQEMLAGPAAIVATSTGEAYRSTDGGQTWTELTRWLNSGASTSAQYVSAIDTDNRGHWLAGFYSGISDTVFLSRSVDNGLTWTAIDVSAWAPGGNKVEDICFGLGGVVIVSADEEVWKSTNSGATWAKVASLSSASWSARHIATDWNGNWVITYAHYASSHRRSTDNGATWSGLAHALNTGAPPNTSPSSIGADRSGNFIAHFYAGQTARSTDSGATWSSLGNGFGGVVSTITESSFIEEGDGVFLAGLANNQICYSSDDGANWTAGTSQFGCTSGSLGAEDASTDGGGNWIGAASYSAGGGQANIGLSGDGAVTWDADPDYRINGLTPVELAQVRQFA